MPVDPVREGGGGIRRIIENGNLPAGKSLPAEFPDRVPGYFGARFIKRAVRFIPDEGVIKRNGIPVPVQVRFPDNLEDPADRHMVRLPAG